MVVVSACPPGTRIAPEALETITLRERHAKPPEQPRGSTKRHQIPAASRCSGDEHDSRGRYAHCVYYCNYLLRPFARAAFIYRARNSQRTLIRARFFPKHSLNDIRADWNTDDDCSTKTRTRKRTHRREFELIASESLDEKCVSLPNSSHVELAIIDQNLEKKMRAILWVL